MNTTALAEITSATLALIGLALAVMLLTTRKLVQFWKNLPLASQILSIGTA